VTVISYRKIKIMSDQEYDPYAVSSDEDDDKGPPPKIEIEGRSTAGLQELKESLVVKDEMVKDENTLREIEELRQKNLKQTVDMFENIDELTSKQISSKLEELEQLRGEASVLRQHFEKGGDQSELSEEKKRQLIEEFSALKAERERAKMQLEEEQAALAAANQIGKEDVQVAADHASKMAAKWEKIHAKEAKKAEKSKMPQKVGK